MGLSKTIWSKPIEYLTHNHPEAPVMFFAPGALQDTARRFIDRFPGQVAYAVRANPEEAVISNLAAAGMRAFSVSSPAEVKLILRLAPEAQLHYSHPIRSLSEVALAVASDVDSYAVDCGSELEKLLGVVPQGKEIAVRFTLTPSKFGADMAEAAALLARVAAAGYQSALAFHVGTQCHDASVWTRHIEAAAQIATMANVRIARLNVGGAFPSHRMSQERPDLTAIFAAIDLAAKEAFGEALPTLVCEPGRGMVADCFSLAARVKALRGTEDVFLNDGIHGALNELAILGLTDRIEVITPAGQHLAGEGTPRTLYGPTNNPADRLPGQIPLPAQMAEGDYVIFHDMGAYSIATANRFNGYGESTFQTVLFLS